MAKMLERLGIDFTLNISSDPFAAHQNPYAEMGAVPLSEVAISNLKTWYSDDFSLLEKLAEFMGDEWA